MAEITPTVYDLSRTTAVNYTDNKTAATSANNYNIANNGKVAIVTECTAGGTATVATPNTVDALAITDLTLTLTAAKILLWGPFPTKTYNNSSQNIVITFSANTNLLAIRM